MASDDLLALEARVRREVEMTAHPRTEWMAPQLHQGRPGAGRAIGVAGRDDAAQIADAENLTLVVAGVEFAHDRHELRGDPDG